MKINIIKSSSIDTVTNNIKNNVKRADSVLPKEMSLEKKIYITTQADLFERVKDKIQISLDNHIR